MSCLTQHVTSINVKLWHFNIYFRFSSVEHTQKKKNCCGEQEDKWRKTAERGKWSNRESDGRVKQLARWFLTALRCVLMPPAQRPRSEVRRNRATEAWESVRKCLEVGKFSKLNRENSQQQAGRVDWMFGEQTDWQRELKTETKKRHTNTAHVV